MSRFVSEGSKEDNAAESNDAWTAARAAVKAAKAPKQTAGSGIQDGGKSLYETLQANKEKKEADFQESQRLKNQFQTLNDDDVGFLDSVLETSRAKEAAEKKETADQLDIFRKQREFAEKEASQQAVGADHGSANSVIDSWTKKRRRKDVEDHASKLRKTSSADAGPKIVPIKQSSPSALPSASEKTQQPVEKNIRTAKEPAVVSKGLGLGAYESDDD